MSDGDGLTLIEKLLVAAVAAAVAFSVTLLNGTIVFYLWNGCLTEVASVPRVTWTTALGLVVLLATVGGYLNGGSGSK